MARKLITADETTNELPASAKFSSGSELEAQVNAMVADKQDAGSYVLTSDARLTDTRTPKTHTHTIADVTGLQAKITELEARLTALESPA